MEKLVVTTEFSRVVEFEGDTIEYYVDENGRLEVQVYVNLPGPDSGNKKIRQSEFKEGNWLQYDWSDEDSVEEDDNETTSVD